MLEANAFSPGGITSFFEIRDRQRTGQIFKDLVYAGARGGGLVTSLGITTRVRLKRDRKSHISISINGRLAPEARTSFYTVSKLLEMSREKYEVRVDHAAEIPIGAGYGTSAAGALSAALAFSEAADLSLSVNQVARVAHVAEIVNETGLGTVPPILTGGFVVTRKSGGPGVAVVDRLIVPRDLRIITACFGPISTKTVLRSKKTRAKINELASEAFRSIDASPAPAHFMKASLKFAQGLDMMSKNTRRLIGLMNDSGAIGATQNMVGQATHAVAEKDLVEGVMAAVRKEFPRIWARCCDFDFTGARLL